MIAHEPRRSDDVVLFSEGADFLFALESLGDRDARLALRVAPARRAVRRFLRMLAEATRARTFTERTLRFRQASSAVDEALSALHRVADGDGELLALVERAELRLHRSLAELA